MMRSFAGSIRRAVRLPRWTKAADGREQQRIIRLLFDPSWYRQRHPEIGTTDPFDHFLRFGMTAGADPSIYFDREWYLHRYPDVLASGSDPFLHFVNYGLAEGRNGSPVFDADFYRVRNPDQARTGAPALIHYLEHGRAELRSPNLHFDPAWYLTRYPLAEPARRDPLAHYLHEGAAAGFDPAPTFSTARYVSRYPDIGRSALNPLLHFLTMGEGRGYRAFRSRPDDAFLRRGPSRATQESAMRLLATLGRVEPHPLPEEIEDLWDLPIADDLPPALVTGWRRLYQSLTRQPDFLLLLPSVDDACLQSLQARLMQAARSGGSADRVLVLATDAVQPCIGGSMPAGIEWRSLAECADHLSTEHRTQIVTALINHLRPRSVLVLDSEAGWSTLVRHGHAIRRMARLGALILPRPHDGADRPTGADRHLRTVLPFLTSVVVGSPSEADAIKAALGLPPPEAAKLTVLAFDAPETEWLRALHADGAFLSKRFGRP